MVDRYDKMAERLYTEARRSIDGPVAFGSNASFDALVPRIAAALRAAVEAEREACAEIVEDTDILEFNPYGYERADDAMGTLNDAAKRIRARRGT